MLTRLNAGALASFKQAGAFCANSIATNQADFNGYLHTLAPTRIGIRDKNYLWLTKRIRVFVSWPLKIVRVFYPRSMFVVDLKFSRQGLQWLGYPTFICRFAQLYFVSIWIAADTTVNNSRDAFERNCVSFDLRPFVLR
jgi:hypothetical protein